jgi:hypothetical protein
MKYLLIGKSFSELKRGGHIITKRFASVFPDYLEYKETSNAIDLEKLNEQYKKIIFATHVPAAYATPVNLVRLLNINHVIYIKGPLNFSLYNSCTNGFHYYKSYPNIKHYIPHITDFPKATQPKDICLGFYSRKWLTMDSYIYFVNMLEKLPPVDVCIMGTPSRLIEKTCKKNFKHTYDNTEFFNSITHYVFPKSKQYIDPFPNSLLEAVQAGKQIIIPTIEGRKHRDGIDDIQEFIEYHNEIDIDNYYDNSTCLLRAKTFRNFYLKVFANNYEHSFDRSKYSSMREWVYNEVI